MTWYWSHWLVDYLLACSRFIGEGTYTGSRDNFGVDWRRHGGWHR